MTTEMTKISARDQEILDGIDAAKANAEAGGYLKFHSSCDTIETEGSAWSFRDHFILKGQTLFAVNIGSFAHGFRESAEVAGKTSFGNRLLLPITQRVSEEDLPLTMSGLPKFEILNILSVSMQAITGPLNGTAVVFEAGSKSRRQCMGDFANKLSARKNSLKKGCMDLFPLVRLSWTRPQANRYDASKLITYPVIEIESWDDERLTNWFASQRGEDPAEKALEAKYAPAAETPPEAPATPPGRTVNRRKAADAPKPEPEKEPVGAEDIPF